ncbi:hypothetical protein CISIN_1g045524mg [Citrus sinensis]|uniref:Uncharacterized protein n=1 Tax=Citrus sinensis TaxID=2711 RepID=A0A067EUL8_CITSI|nr:hypothetical protein CISIN_1g045524mg [Citrus sinensis]
MKYSSSSSSSILRSLSFGIPMRLSAASSAVVPLPIRSSFDRQLTAELDALQLSSSASSNESHYTWILQALKASTTAQQITLASLANHGPLQDSDRKIIDQYLDSNIRMLDACNELTERIEIVHNYVESLRVVSHLLEGSAELHPATLARIGGALDSYSRLGEMLSGSMALTSTVCAILENALSFKSKRGLLPLMQPQSQKTSWSCSLQQLQNGVKEQGKTSSIIGLFELQQLVKVSTSLRDQMKHRKQNDHQLRVDVEEMKRSCGKMEEGIKPLEESVKELYRSLISVRMALLGILSQI